MNDSEPDAEIRAAAAMTFELLKDQQSLFLEEHSAMARWLTASLLVINSGGAVAVFTAHDQLSHPVVDASPFLIGVFLSLLCAVLNQRANQGGSKILGEVIGHMIAVSQTGELTKEIEDNANALPTKMARLGRWPVMTGWASAILFGVGAIVTGSDSAPRNLSNERRCEALQTDMLAAKPLRTDGPELFQALGCRPQGQGSVYAMQ